MFCAEDRLPLGFKDHILLWLLISASLPGLTSFMEHFLSWWQCVTMDLWHPWVQNRNWSTQTQHEPPDG